METKRTSQTLLAVCALVLLSAKNQAQEFDLPEPQPLCGLAFGMVPTFLNGPTRMVLFESNGGSFIAREAVSGILRVAGE